MNKAQEWNDGIASMQAKIAALQEKRAIETEPKHKSLQTRKINRFIRAIAHYQEQFEVAAQMEDDAAMYAAESRSENAWLTHAEAGSFYDDPRGN